MVKRLAGDLPAVTVAGAFRERVAELLPDVEVVDSELELPTAHAIHQWTLNRAGVVHHSDFLVPLTENSGLFDG